MKIKIIETCPKCGHDLVDLVIATYPPIPKKECWNCGWSWTGEQEQEAIVRVPFGGNTINITEQPSLNDYLNAFNSTDSLVNNFGQSPCDNCSNNPKNGGNGICNCILGLSKVTC